MPAARKHSRSRKAEGSDRGGSGQRGRSGAAWKGSLKISLIRIPIQVFPATTASSDVSFHQLHRKCHTRIQYKKWCPHCEEEVGPADIVKGHETSRGRMAVVEDDEIKALKPESTKTIDISDVVDDAVIDPIYIERSYYVAPDGTAAGSPYSVLRDALEGRAGVGRLAIHGREYLVAVVARENAIVMHTLRTAGEVREVSQVPGLAGARGKSKADELKLARQVLDNFESGKDLTSYTDHYQEALKRMLAAKDEEDIAEEPSESEEKRGPKKVVNLMDALRRSLEQAKTGKRSKPAAKVLKHAPAKRKKAS